MRLSASDRALVTAAGEAIRRGFVPEWHHIGAALEAASGRVYTAVNLDTYVGSCAVCAEACALGSAYASGERAFVACAAVRWSGRGEPVVVAPCGRCREMLFDYGDPYVVVPTSRGLAKQRAGRLLPDAYRRDGEARGDPSVRRAKATQSIRPMRRRS